MGMREKLIDILRAGNRVGSYCAEEGALKRIANHLIANGVTIPVRCKDCKYNVANMKPDPLDMADYSDITCSYFMTDGMNSDDFCSYGERKCE